MMIPSVWQVFIRVIFVSNCYDEIIVGVFLAFTHISGEVFRFMTTFD